MKNMFFCLRSYFSSETKLTWRLNAMLATMKRRHSQKSTLSRSWSVRQKRKIWLIQSILYLMGAPITYFIIFIIQKIKFAIYVNFHPRQMLKALKCCKIRFIISLPPFHTIEGKYTNTINHRWFLDGYGYTFKEEYLQLKF